MSKAQWIAGVLAITGTITATGVSVVLYHNYRQECTHHDRVTNDNNQRVFEIDAESVPYNDIDGTSNETKETSDDGGFESLRLDHEQTQPITEATTLFKQQIVQHPCTGAPLVFDVAGAASLALSIKLQIYSVNGSTSNVAVAFVVDTASITWNKRAMRLYQDEITVRKGLKLDVYFEVLLPMIIAPYGKNARDINETGENGFPVYMQFKAIVRQLPNGTHAVMLPSTIRIDHDCSLPPSLCQPRLDVIKKAASITANNKTQSSDARQGRVFIPTAIQSGSSSVMTFPYRFTRASGLFKTLATDKSEVYHLIHRWGHQSQVLMNVSADGQKGYEFCNTDNVTDSNVVDVQSLVCVVHPMGRVQIQPLFSFKTSLHGTGVGVYDIDVGSMSGIQMPMTIKALSQSVYVINNRWKVDIESGVLQRTQK